MTKLGSMKLDFDFPVVRNSLGEQLTQVFQDIDFPSISQKVLSRVDWDELLSAVQSVLDSIPESSLTRAEILSRFKRTIFPGIDTGYKRDIEAILRMIDAADSIENDIPWGAAQMLAFAALEGMIATYLIDKGVLIENGKFVTGESLIKRVEFEGKDLVVEKWHSQDESGRHVLAHGRSLAYPTIESFYETLDNAVRVSEAIETGSLNISRRIAKS